MGDPKKPKKKYSTPRHPWEKERIDEEKVLMKEYHFGNKKEIWKANSTLEKFKDQIKKLIASSSVQAEREKTLLVRKLINLGLINENAQFDDILGLSIKDLLERRLQTLVYRKGLARSNKQARQFIIHKHILVAGKVISVPSYLVKIKEEDSITFVSSSPFSNEDHAERTTKEEVEKKAAKQKALAEKRAEKEANNRFGNKRRRGR